MASFTDIIPQFNPYVQQLPVEAMVQVGMEKQKRYDEGIQKIQSQIDNIAGLDIAQDAQRAYLQSKLNELGNNLRNVAAGDFSNFQLVNSVGGMTNQIVKDPRIVNALSSTKAYRKGIEDMATLTKEGKASASRTWEFKNAANAWLNGDVDSSFNTLYKPYTNYKKNSLEVLKGLTKNKNITEDAFDYDSNGNMVIKDATLRKEMAGISPEQIQQALLVGLTPDDWEQISVDGRYNYANVDDQAFANSVNTSYKSKYNAFAEQRTILENAKSSTSSATEKVALDNKIRDIDKILNNITTEYNNVSKTFAQGDVESAKARLFTSNFMNGFSNAFSFTETSQEYKTNVFAQDEQWRQNKAQDWKKFILGYNLDLENLKVRKAELLEKKEENRIARLTAEGYGALGTPVDPSTVPELVLDDVVAQTQGYIESIEKSDSDFIKSQGKDKAWLDQQRQAYLKSPNGVDVLVKEHFDDTEAKRKRADENQIMVNKINAEADRKYGTTDNLLPKNTPNILYRDGKGTTYTYTAKDFVDFNTKKNRYATYTTKPIRPGSDSGGELVVKFDDERAKAELSPKEYILYQADKRAWYANKGQVKLGSADKALYDNMESYNSSVNRRYQRVLTEKNKFIADEVKGRVLAAQGLSVQIPTTNKAQKETFSNILSTVVNIADKPGGIAESPGFDKNILKQLAESGDAEGSINVIEATEFAPAMYQITARGKAGTTTFNLTPEQKMTAFGDRFEPSQALRAFRPYQMMMQKFRDIDPETNEPSPYMSTNPVKGDITFQNSSLNGSDFPNVKSYGVTGAVVTQNGGKTYSLRLNFYNPITGDYINNIGYPRTLNEEEVAGAMLNITDAWVYEMLNNGNIATKNDLQILQRASKKPL